MSSYSALKIRDMVHEEIAELRRSNFRRLSFARALENKFERETGRERAHRLWIEGLVAIVVLNLCLLADYLLVKDRVLISLVKQTEIVTPIALVVNYMMRMKLPPWLREGSVAAGMTAIACINLYVEGGATAATAMFQIVSVLITMLFVNVVMRLRFPYAATATLLMAAGGTWFATHAAGLKPGEQIVGLSMMSLGAVMTLMAAYSLERQERLNYLLIISSEMQSAELHRLSNIDRLTELPNRRAFDERFETLWKQGIVSRTQLSVIVIDIDHFKVVNDVYGHLYGDEVLRQVAALLPQVLRAQDLAARFGGEEFVILLPDMNQKTALEVAERVRQVVEAAGTPVSGQGHLDEVLKVTVSCGVSTCVPDRRLSQEKLLKNADRALYKAKDDGRNRVEFRPCEASPATAGESSGIRRTSAVRRLAKIRESNRSR